MKSLKEFKEEPKPLEEAKSDEDISDLHNAIIQGSAAITQ